MDKESRNAFMVIGAVLVALLAIGLIFSGRPGDAVIGDTPVAAHGEGEELAGTAESETPAAVAGAEEDTATAATEMAEEAQEASPEDVAAVSEIRPGAEESQAGGPRPETLTDPVAGALHDEGEQAAAEGAAAPAETDQAPAEQAEEPEAADGEQAAPEQAGDEAAQEVALAGDPAGGERVFRQCQACHQIGEGAENRVGPMLTGIVGRPIASVEGFTYSDSLTALGQEGREWTPEELRGFLANPREYVPGTAMAYAGVRSEEDLENLIAYLASVE